MFDYTFFNPNSTNQRNETFYIKFSFANKFYIKSNKNYIYDSIIA